MAQHIRDLGSFESIQQVWTALPGGGMEGDYLTINGNPFAWNKYIRQWQNDTTVINNPARELQTHDGDMNIGNDARIGGNLVVIGNIINDSIKNGLSAFELAVKGGFSGSEADWLNSLIGKSAYQIWLEQAGNAGKNMTQFLAWMKDTQAIHGPKYIEDESLIDTVNDRMTLFYVPSGTSYKVVFVDEGGGTNTLANRIGDITNYAGIYDVSADNEDNGVIPRYGTLSEAIADISQAAVKGGMTIKYIGTDGKYHQYRYLLADTTDNDKFTDEDNWIAENDVAESVSEHNDILENCYVNDGEDTTSTKTFDNNDLIDTSSMGGVYTSHNRLGLPSEKYIPIDNAHRIEVTFKSNCVTSDAIAAGIKGRVFLYDQSKTRINDYANLPEAVPVYLGTNDVSCDIDLTDYPVAAYMAPFFTNTDNPNSSEVKITNTYINPQNIDIVFYTKAKQTIPAASEEMVNEVKAELEQKIEEHSPIVVINPVSAQFNPYFITSNLSATRARFYHEIKKNTNIKVTKNNQNSSFLYQINAHKFVNEAGEGNAYHTNNGRCYYTQTVKSWSEVQQDGNTNLDFSSDDWDWFTIQLRIGNGSNEITESDIGDFLEDYSIEIKEDANDVESIEDATKTYKLYALSYKVSTIKVDNIDSPQGEVVTEFLAKPKQNISLKIKLPIWMKVRLLRGLRDGGGSDAARTDTQYYYNGDTIILPYTDGGVRFKFSSVLAYGSDLRSESSVSVADCKHLLAQGAISFTYVDDDCDDILIRNYDAEKYLGAIRATPSNEETPNLTTIVHVSDIHGDAFRFDSACKFANHINADILINTGDDKYMWLADGSLFIKDILSNYSLDYANCIGNHDSYFDSLKYGGSKNDIYNQTIEPYIDSYGYILEATGVRYYHKDLSEKLIRIISLDLYDGLNVNGNLKARISNTQIEWFIDTLASTPENYGVIVILHQVPHKNVSIIEDKTNFNDATMSPRFAAIDDEEYMTAGTISGNPIAKIIDAFIGKTNVSGSYTQKNAAGSTNETITYEANFSNDVNSGVEFIAYLNGHTHRDWVGTIDDCIHRQVNINVCSTSGISQSNGLPTNSDIFRGSSGSTQDAFNVYTINRIDKTIGICRIGSNLSKDLRDRKVMFVKYVDDEV